MPPRKYFPYEDAKRFIEIQKEQRRVESLSDYNDICELTPLLPKDPKGFYKYQFKGWLDYLGLQNEEWCSFIELKEKIRNHLGDNNVNIFQHRNIIKILRDIDSSIPPSDFFEDVYYPHNIGELFEETPVFNFNIKHLNLKPVKNT